MAWAILIVAGLFEVGWAIGLKYTEGFTRFWPTVGTVAAMIVSLWLLGIAMKSLPVGTAYAIWVGVGAVGTAILGIVLKLLYPGRFDRVAVGIYLAMGWSGVMLYDAVVKALPALVLGFILAGGLLYSFGVIFHAWRRLRFQNAIWHGFVLAGAACHYTAVLDLVLS